MTRYGFLGLGIMGSAMASNLVKAGFEVTVWNRTAERTASLEALGATTAATPAEVVGACEITFAMVSDPAATHEVVFGEGGVLEGVSAGHDYVEMSTIDDVTSHEVAQAVSQRGARYLEAPVTGTKKPAEEGQLVILGAGDPTLFEAAKPAFDVMGKLAVFLGEVGNGERMKLVINGVMGEVMAALAEGAALAEKAGLEPETLLQLLDAGIVASPLFRVKGPLLLSREYPASFPLKHMQKDLRLALELAERIGQPLHCMAAVNQVYKRAAVDGHADEDLSAVFEAIA